MKVASRGNINVFLKTVTLAFMQWIHESNFSPLYFIKLRIQSWRNHWKSVIGFTTKLGKRKLHFYDIRILIAVSSLKSFSYFCFVLKISVFKTLHSKCHDIFSGEESPLACESQVGACVNLSVPVLGDFFMRTDEISGRNSSTSVILQRLKQRTR